MSEDVHYKGKLKPTGKTVEEFLSDVEIPDNYDDATEYFEDTFYKNAHVVNDQVYIVEMKDIDPCSGIANASKNDDGSIDFELKYYNGGASFSEVLDEAVDKL